MRGQQPPEPVTHEPMTGMWNIFGYPEAAEVLSNPQIFSSNTARLLPEAGDASAGDMTQMDPPDHFKLRRLVSSAFSRKVVADHEPQVIELANQLLDEASGKDRIELVNDLAYPLPVIVIAEMLGVPSSDRHLFKGWVDALFEQTQQFSFADDDQRQRDVEEGLNRVRPILEYLGQHAAERRRSPREDLLTRLVQAEVDGERLTDTEIVNFANILLIAGHITTTMSLANTVLCLDTHPEQQRAVRADPSLIPAAIEESLRLFSPFAASGRVTNEEVELGGKKIGANQMLYVWLAAANRDERQFPNPHAFDVSRSPNPHFGFGHGVHHCFGAPLARLQVRLALKVLLDRFPELRRDPDNPPRFMPSPNMTGVTSLTLLV
ncbi:cytochrome P450 [Actinoplanes missouriensis]|uniref:cytochrome P450 n=1 Tax=Actinoplanes missouriensis TaxID=1866 RepID=UPI0033F9923E